jgi:hypothetical protein
MNYYNRLIELSYGDKFSFYNEHNKLANFIVVFEIDDTWEGLTKCCCLESEIDIYIPGKIYYIQNNSEVILE